MAWQDNFFLIGEVFFIFTLLPVLLNKKSQIPFKTSFSSFAVLLIFFVYPFATLNLMLATVSTIGSGLMWFLIAMFRRTK
jgi:hypothetical protein